MIKAIFFDLFFTLIYPKYSDRNEYDVLGISAMEWEKYAENDHLYRERALGNVQTEKEIIDKIVDMMPFKSCEREKQEILKRREERMKRALFTVDDNILETLRKIHEMGIKIGLISNADIIDSKHWGESTLSKFFDVAIFSCDVGMLKPSIEIYRLAMNRLGVTPEESFFVGDGGSNELYGAQKAGMKTVFTEYLDDKSDSLKEEISKYADYHVNSFDEILKYIY